MINRWLDQVAAARNLHRLELESELQRVKEERRRALTAAAVDRALREALPKPVRQEEPVLGRSNGSINEPTIRSFARVRLNRKGRKTRLVKDRKPQFVQAARVLDPDQAAGQLHPDRPTNVQLAPEPAPRVVTEYATDKVAANPLAGTDRSDSAWDAMRREISRGLDRLLADIDARGPWNPTAKERELLDIAHRVLDGQTEEEIAKALQVSRATIKRAKAKIRGLSDAESAI